MFSFRRFGSIKPDPKALQLNSSGRHAKDKKAARRKGRPAIKSAFAEESVTVPMASYTNRAGCKGTQSSTDALDFLRIQLTSALANQYSVLVIHVFSPYFCHFESIEQH
jgi:hypothetical protein